MDTTVDLNRELTAEERRAMFSILWMSCKMGKLEHGKIVSVAGQFLVAPKTVSRVWKHILSVMGAHLTNELMFAVELFDSKMLPLRMFPDHVFESGKKGSVGRKKAHDRQVLGELAANVPVLERGTIRNLATAINIPKSTVHRLVEEGLFRPHTSDIKPLLNQKQKEARLCFATSKIDVRSLSDNPENSWQYVGMFNEVHVDEKWFNETFETRRMFLVKDEPEPERKTRHKGRIPKIMFICPQARPRYDPDKKHAWDGKIALISIGNWVRQQRRSKY
jgi:hypothetical protein